jgi:hypothetical protein
MDEQLGNTSYLWLAVHQGLHLGRQQSPHVAFRRRSQPK